MTTMLCPFCGDVHPAGTASCPATRKRLRGLLPLGAVVDGKYRIDGIIGAGGMGIVYRAEHIKIAREIALKMLLPEYLAYPDLVARVEREARTAGQIAHPNIVSIVDLGVTADHGPYIAMEVLRGQDLAALTEHSGGRLDPPRAVGIMLEALAGVEAAHNRGVIHRDLKPNNIMLVRDLDLDSELERVKVLDFGISKLRGDFELNSLTRPGDVMGTPHFMAPEQAAGASDPDGRIDLYACGVVLYAVLCNGLPYNAENYNLLINDIFNKPPTPILAYNPALDPRLAAVVMKSIAKRPEQRYQTAREMSDALTYWYDNRNAPYVPERVHTAQAPAARGRNSEAAIKASGPRKSVSPQLGAGAREAPRGGPQAITQFDEEFSPDDPLYVDHVEATVVVPTVLPDGVIEEELDDDLEPAELVQPRGSRPSTPPSPPLRPPAGSADRPARPPPTIPDVPRPLRSNAFDTLRSAASRTILALHRLRTIFSTNPSALRRLHDGTRLAVEADHEEREDGALRKRALAALESVQAIEQALHARLDAIPDKKLWLKRLPASARGQDEPFVLKNLRTFLTTGRRPSLYVLGLLVRDGWRALPPDLADDVRRVLGVPRGLEGDLVVAGQVRNALAHRAEYEANPKESLREAEGRLVRMQVNDVTRLDAPPETLDWLQWLCACVLERQMRPKPDA